MSSKVGWFHQSWHVPNIWERQMQLCKLFVQARSRIVSLESGPLPSIRSNKNQKITQVTHNLLKMSLMSIRAWRSALRFIPLLQVTLRHLLHYLIIVWGFVHWILNICYPEYPLIVYLEKSLRKLLTHSRVRFSLGFCSTPWRNTALLRQHLKGFFFLRWTKIY